MNPSGFRCFWRVSHHNAGISRKYLTFDLAYKVAVNPTTAKSPDKLDIQLCEDAENMKRETAKQFNKVSFSCFASSIQLYSRLCLHSLLRSCLKIHEKHT